jgi:hypothetical protein
MKPKFLFFKDSWGYAIIFKDLCTEGHKSMNNLPKKIQLNKKVRCLRLRNNLLERFSNSKEERMEGIGWTPI